MNTDSEIIRSSLDDPGRFADIFERHATNVEAFIASRIGPGSKDDVLSETFLVGFRRRAKFDLSSDSARPWLLGIATRIIRRHRAIEAANWRSFVAASGSAETAGSTEMDASSNRMDAAARVRELGPRIAALSARERETLFLYAWGDLTYEQVAEALRVPVGTVRSRLNRIRQRLLAPPIKASVAVAMTDATTTARYSRKETTNGHLEQRA